MPASPEQKKAYVEAMQRAVQDAAKSLQAAIIPPVVLSVQTSLLIVAHGAYESGWGLAKAAREGFNFWNLTAGPAWAGEVTLGNDTEYKAGSSTARAIVQRFRKYKDPSLAVLDYVKFLSSQRYADAKLKLLKGDASFVVDLGVYNYAPDGKTLVNAWMGLPYSKGGFYTLPIARYVKEYDLVLAEVKRIIGVC